MFQITKYFLDYFTIKLFIYSGTNHTCGWGSQKRDQHSYICTRSKPVARRWVYKLGWVDAECTSCCSV